MSGPRVVLGVGGGIAAYKVCELLRLFTESGYRVRVVPTPAAVRFVGEPTWSALSGQPVITDIFADVHNVPHVRLGQDADFIVVAPATADLLARAAAGMADDLLTSILLVARCPVLYVPAMHTEMWRHPATVANVATVRQRGAFVMEPAAGRLTGADTGPGRLPDPADIFAEAARLISSPSHDLSGKRVVVTAGGTREPIDPVRFIGNRSSGKQGYALARRALARGAEVTLIAAHVLLGDLPGARMLRVETTRELLAATMAELPTADAVVMAAAPSDYRPRKIESEKIKRGSRDGGITLELVENPDIAREVGMAKRPHQVLVAFAAETSEGEQAIAYGQAKLQAKRADLIVINEVGPGKGFDVDHNTAVVLSADGTRAMVSTRSKDDVADAIWDRVLDCWQSAAV